MLYLSSPDDIEDAVSAGYSGPGWYFWDETDANIIGPYKNEVLCSLARKRYIDWLNKEEIKK